MLLPPENVIACVRMLDSCSSLVCGPADARATAMSLGVDDSDLTSVIGRPPEPQRYGLTIVTLPMHGSLCYLSCLRRS
jgi:hypothetical protein